MLTDDDGIRAVNSALFDRHRPTDVISIAYASGPHAGGQSAEVFVNVERALAVARRAARASAELALYIAHGIDHLAGAVDRTPAQRRRMLTRESAWLRRAAADGVPVDGLVQPDS